MLIFSLCLLLFINAMSIGLVFPIFAPLFTASTQTLFAYGTPQSDQTFWYTMNTLHKGILIPQTEESIEKVEWFNKSEIVDIVEKNSYPAILDVLKNID